MMTRRQQTTAVVLAVLASLMMAGTANAGSDHAQRHEAMRKACSEQGGRFEQSWRYNDQGMQWGDMVSCSTSIGFVKCEDEVCRSGRWSEANPGAPANGVPGLTNGTAQASAGPSTFADLLAQLTGQ